MCKPTPILVAWAMLFAPIKLFVYLSALTLFAYANGAYDLRTITCPPNAGASTTTWLCWYGQECADAQGSHPCHGSAPNAPPFLASLLVWISVGGILGAILGLMILAGAGLGLYYICCRRGHVK